MVALKQLPAWQVQAESRLSNQLNKLFSEAFEKTVTSLLKSTVVPADDVTRDKVVRDIWGVEEDFQESLSDSAVDSAQHGRNRVVSELQKKGTSISFSDFSKQTEKLIRQHSFEASERTLARMVGDVMDNLSKSYREGLGIDDAATELESKFDSMKDYELKRVARTEIQSFQNEGAYLTEQELKLGYHMWWTAEDERVRDETANHVKMHGQIVKLGEPFSNGLYYPGDRSKGSANIKEWINCRCRVVPFLMPEGKMAPPGKSYFYERDLVKAEQPPSEQPPVEQPVEERDYRRFKPEDPESHEYGQKEIFNKVQLTDAEKESLSQYGGVFYTSVNDQMRKGIPIPDDYACRKDIVEQLKSAVGKGSVPDDVVVFRGMDQKFIDKFMKKNKITDINQLAGKVIEDKGFVSTSLDSKVPLNFLGTGKKGGGVIMDIKVPKGSKGLYISSLGYDYEREILFSPANFVIQSAKTETVQLTKKKTRDIVRLEVLMVQ